MKLALKSLLTASATALAVAVAAPAMMAEPPQTDYEPPRMPDGTPDMQGYWTNASLTTLEKPDNLPIIVPEKQAMMMAGLIEASAEADNAPTDPDAPAYEAGGAEVGGYNRFWMDFGSALAKVRGEYRSTWIVEPADGKLPYTEAGRKMAEDRLNEQREDYDNPEVRAAAERCTVGFGSTGGPPMLNVLYNNNYQIVQAPDKVAILVEMNHQTRMIRIDEEHRPEVMDQWLGDSVGSWDGDTLVVETTNFEPDISLRAATRHRLYMSPDAKVTEHFTRISPEEIFYEFWVEDPEVFTQVWKGEMILRQAEGPIYEYACHEANYSLPGILAGARREEKEAATAGGSK
ncbi:hypothetical protein [Henriciella litoralis]|uniref:hypothetical protein n=1 Tax=Henriciella litoralis TaxID=568102 RepID=UPI001F3711CC|nr:hypothetical protein [Henriciella litoralis]